MKRIEKYINEMYNQNILNDLRNKIYVQQQQCARAQKKQKKKTVFALSREELRRFVMEWVDKCVKQHFSAKCLTGRFEMTICECLQTAFRLILKVISTT